LRDSFFGIFGTISKSLFYAKDVEKAEILIKSLKFKYRARDFDSLFSKINIFDAITQSLKSNNAVTQAWRPFSKTDSSQSFTPLFKQLISYFRDNFLSILQRVSNEATENVQ